MARVFVSYVRENTAAVERLAEVLRVYGIDVWLDRDQIKPGQRWKDAIRAGITHGDFFLACFSKEYGDRSRTYMNEELTLAIEELRLRPTDRAWFIPVLLSETTIPDRSIGAGETLRSLQWVSLYPNWHDGVARILSVVQPDSAKLHELLQGLQLPSARARIQAIDALGALGPLADRAVPQLLTALKDQNETVRAAAAEALGLIGIAREDVVAELLALLRKAEDYYGIGHATVALSHLGALGVSALLEATTFEGEGVGGRALDQLTRMGKAAVPQLIHVVESGHQHTAVADEALRRMHDPAALPDLVDALANAGPALRATAAAAIGEVFRWRRGAEPAEAKAAVAALMVALEDPPARGAAIRALGEAGGIAKAAVPRLIEALQDDAVGAYAIEALGGIGEASADAVPALIAAVAVKATRPVAIRALGQIGAAARDAIPTLVAALNDSDVRENAVEALGRMGPAAQDAVGRLLPALDDVDSHVRWATAQALGAIGRPARESVPKLLQAFQESEDWAFRFRIADALGKIGDRQAVAPLMGALSAGHVHVRSSAARALGRIGSASAIPALLQQSGDEESGVRWVVVEALGDLGTSKDGAVVARLVEILDQDDEAGVRRAAAKSLEKVGGPQAVSALRKALDDEDASVRVDAQAAIHRLETP